MEEIGRSLCFPAMKYINPAYLMAFSLIVGMANAAPTVVTDTASLHRGQKIRLNVLANDTGSINPATLAIVQAPASGTAVITSDFQVLYTQTTGGPTNDTFTYKVADTGGQYATGTVNLSFASTLRIANPRINIPAAPPTTALALVDALPGLSFSSPVCMRTPPGETQRLFVCEKGGLLKVVPDVTASAPTASTFLNLPALLTSRGESIVTGSECGLLGVAFHPNYATNRQFYVFYSVKVGSISYQRVSRFTTQAGNPNAADTTSELNLINQVDEAQNHNGGDMHFGPDGYLYISVGDEGDANDTRNNSQTIIKDFFSGILRIDVDRKAGNVEPTAHAAIPLDSGVARFSIPKDNPFVLPANGGTWDGKYNGITITSTDLPKVRREFFCTGLRNPWRFSIDPATGQIWCGDVGQGAREEVDIIQKGANYGWAFREATINGPKSGSAPANFDTLYHTPPIYNYDRNTANFNGFSITGGIVYRGTRIGSLTGKYIFGDYGSGNIWSLQQNGTNPPTVERLAGQSGIVAFAPDPSNQDVLIADINNNRILRLVSNTTVGNFPTTLSATGLFADLSDLSPSPGLLPYSVNLPFWSDHAEKRRWFIVPDGSSSFGWQKDTPWNLPADTIWVKHFDMLMNRNAGNATPVRKRIETRVFVKNSTGAYGVTYRWNDAETEATLVADGGEDFTLNVTDNGAPAPQRWHIPSRSECMSCHSPSAGHALSFNTRQLNLTSNILGYNGNQIDTLRQNGFFTGTPPASSNLLPRHVRADETAYSLEARARSYLAVNCSYCHTAGGTAPAAWDGSAALTLAQTGLINGSVTNNGGDPLNKLVVPGSSAHSVVLQRMAATNGFTRMPPIATNVIDQGNISLVTDWINNELATRQSYADWRLAKFGSASSAEGAATEDADHDGVTNEAEFLAGTNPLNGASILRPQLETTGGNVKLSFTLPINRSFQILTSANLQTWTPWDIPGNQGTAVGSSLIELTAPLTESHQFYKLEIKEN